MLHWDFLLFSLNKGRLELTMLLSLTELKNFHLQKARRKRFESIWTSEPCLACKTTQWPPHASFVREPTVSTALALNSRICCISVLSSCGCAII